MRSTTNYVNIKLKKKTPFSSTLILKRNTSPSLVTRAFMQKYISHIGIICMTLSLQNSQKATILKH